MSVKKGSVIKIIIATIAIEALAAGCASHQSSPPSKRVNRLIVATDTSGSCRPYLGEFASMAARLSAQLDPDKDMMTAYRMDRDTRCYFDGSAPDSPDEFQETLVRELSGNTARSGTYPARLFSAIARRTAACPEDVDIVVETDGDNDEGRESEATIKAAVARLAANPHVRAIAIVGVTKDSWIRLADAFRPMGQYRFRIFGRTQVSAEAVERFLNDAHAHAKEGKNG